jgi:hypothetical protein
VVEVGDDVLVAGDAGLAVEPDGVVVVVVLEAVDVPAPACTPAPADDAA